MKIVYNVFYITALIVIFIVLLGGSMTKPIFNSISEETLELAGIKRAHIDSADDKIDEVFYSAKKVELQIEKLKNLFSQDEIDESKYKKVKNYFVYGTFYKPLIEMFNYVYRIFFFFAAVILLLCGVISHIICRNMDLRRRVSELERIILGNNKTEIVD
jgi:hypothetical protein